MNRFLLALNNFFIKMNDVKLAVDDYSPDKQVTSLEEIANAFRGIMTKIIAPIFGVLGVGAIILVISLGVQYAKAEDADGRKKVQGRLIGAAVGAVIMIAGVVLCLTLDWSSIYTNLAES